MNKTVALFEEGSRIAESAHLSARTAKEWDALPQVGRSRMTRVDTQWEEHFNWPQRNEVLVDAHHAVAKELGQPLAGLGITVTSGPSCHGLKIVLQYGAATFDFLSVEDGESDKNFDALLDEWEGALEEVLSEEAAARAEIESDVTDAFLSVRNSNEWSSAHSWAKEIGDEDGMFDRFADPADVHAYAEEVRKATPRIVAALSARGIECDTSLDLVDDDPSNYYSVVDCSAGRVKVDGKWAPASISCDNYGPDDFRSIISDWVDISMQALGLTPIREPAVVRDDDDDF